MTKSFNIRDSEFLLKKKKKTTTTTRKKQTNQINNKDFFVLIHESQVLIPIIIYPG